MTGGYENSLCGSYVFVDDRLRIHDTGATCRFRTGLSAKSSGAAATAAIAALCDAHTTADHYADELL